MLIIRWVRIGQKSHMVETQIMENLKTRRFGVGHLWFVRKYMQVQRRLHLAFRICCLLAEFAITKPTVFLLRSMICLARWKQLRFALKITWRFTTALSTSKLPQKSSTITAISLMRMVLYWISSSKSETDIIALLMDGRRMNRFSVSRLRMERFWATKHHSCRRAKKRASLSRFQEANIRKESWSFPFRLLYGRAEARMMVNCQCALCSANYL